MSISMEQANKILKESFDPFREYVTVETDFYGEWEYVRNEKGSVALSHLTDINFDGEVLTATETYSEEIPMIREIKELDELVGKWKARGMDEDLYEGAVTEIMSELVSYETRTRPITITNPKFTYNRVATPEEAAEIRKNSLWSRMMKSAKITNVSASGVFNNS